MIRTSSPPGSTPGSTPAERTGLNDGVPWGGALDPRVKPGGGPRDVALTTLTQPSPASGRGLQ